MLNVQGWAEPFCDLVRCVGGDEVNIGGLDNQNTARGYIQLLDFCKKLF